MVEGKHFEAKESFFCHLHHTVPAGFGEVGIKVFTLMNFRKEENASVNKKKK